MTSNYGGFKVNIPAGGLGVTITELIAAEQQELLPFQDAADPSEFINLIDLGKSPIL